MKKGIRKSGILLVTSVFLLLAAGIAGETVLANELEYRELLSQFGQWETIDARGEEGAKFTYVLEFYPEESENGGDLFFGYTDERETEVHFWSGSYYSAGPANVSYGMEYEDCWLYNYYFDTPDGERQGEFAAKINGERLTIMEMGGDAFWPFTSRSAETLEFHPVEILDGDGEFAEGFDEENYEEISYFQVVNCQEWVSLRSEPDVNSILLTTVPLGSVVLDMGEYVNGFHYVSYAGAYGYIHGDFLAPYEDDIYESDEYLQSSSTIPTIMTYEEIISDGYEFLNYTSGEYTVCASREYTEGEIMRIGCFRNGEPVWGYISSIPYSTELQITDAFVAGTAQNPMIIIFNAEDCMMMIDLVFGDIIWEKSVEELPVGGSLVWEVAEDGTIYCGGYYDAGPTAISMDGEILWNAQPDDPDIYWLHKIHIEEPYILAEYVSGNEEGNYVAAFDKNGIQQWVRINKYY